jgi:threonine dehydrogenase-like Zn-dependent dehydrogenase
LRVLKVGLCGTDREIAAFHYGKPPVGADHVVLGHEALAEVVELGPDASLVAKGELVVPTVRRPCTNSRCRPCRVNRPDFCVTGEYIEHGILGAHGFMQEWVVEDERNLVRVPDKLADVAVLIEPLTVAAKAAEQALSTESRFPWERVRTRILALGAGPVGLLGALAARVNGQETCVYSLEPASDPRAQIARGFGATYVSGQDMTLAELGRTYGPFDMIFEAVGVSSVAFEAMQALAPNGMCVLTGMPTPGKLREIDSDAIMRNLVLKNQMVFGVVNAGRSGYVDALRDLEQAMFLFPEAVRALITDVHPIEDAPALLAMRAGIKQVIQLAKEQRS